MRRFLTFDPYTDDLVEMSREELIGLLDEVRETIAVMRCPELTDFARDQSYIALRDAIEIARENEEVDEW